MSVYSSRVNNRFNPNCGSRKEIPNIAIKAYGLYRDSNSDWTASQMESMWKSYTDSQFKPINRDVQNMEQQIKDIEQKISIYEQRIQELQSRIDALENIALECFQARFKDKSEDEDDSFDEFMKDIIDVCFGDVTYNNQDEDTVTCKLEKVATLSGSHIKLVIGDDESTDDESSDDDHDDISRSSILAALIAAYVKALKFKK